MLIKVTRIQVNNCLIIKSDLEDVAKLKQEIAATLDVKTSDIHFTITEIESE